jgi:hypothetical protein
MRFADGKLKNFFKTVAGREVIYNVLYDKSLLRMPFEVRFELHEICVADMNEQNRQIQRRYRLVKKASAPGSQLLSGLSGDLFCFYCPIKILRVCIAAKYVVSYAV